MTRGAAARAGFALPVVLVTVGLLALVTASAATAVASLRTSAQAALDEADAQASGMSAEAEAVFDAATSRFAPDGLQVGEPPRPAGALLPRSRLRLDGRAYRWGGPGLRARAALQDEAGLVNLDASRPDALLRLWSVLGFSALEAATLTDRLLDALDKDDERRPHGAEAFDYAARGLRPPAPGGFDGLPELASVLDWTSIVAGPRRHALAAMATADRAGAAFNINTAPPAALAVVLNLGSEAITRILAARERAPLAGLSALGFNLESAQSPSRPNGRIRFSFTDARHGVGYASRIAPAIDRDGPPWRAFSAVLTRGDLPPIDDDAPVLPVQTAAPAAR